MFDEKIAQIALLRESGLFDRKYFAASVGIHHYSEGIPLEVLYLDSPEYWSARTSCLFDGDYYLKTNSDLSGMRAAPLLHYLLHGYVEGRSPSPFIDIQYILSQLNLEPGSSESRQALKNHSGIRNLLVETQVNPNIFFENEIYARSVDECVPAGVPCIEHYFVKRGRSLSGSFLQCSSIVDMAFYIKQNPDVAAAEKVPLDHFVRNGINEQRSINAAPVVHPIFISGAAHLHGDSTISGLGGFIRRLGGTSHLAGPSWPTPYKEKSLPSLEYRSGKHSLKVHVGIVLFENTEAQIRSLESSLLNEQRICRNVQLTWRYLINDHENTGKYEPLIGQNYVVSEENLGFGRAHNRLMREFFEEQSGDALYVGANPDGYFLPHCISNLAEFAEYWEHNALIEAVSAPMDHPKWHDPITLDTAFVSGACFALPRKLWIECKGFDPGIHMYSEDVDLSWRVRLMGGHLKVCPTARFIHDVTPRFSAPAADEQERARSKAMLVGMRYLCKKWGGDSRLAKIESALLSHMSKDEIAKLPDPELVISKALAARVASFDLDRFAPSRFW